MDTKKILKICKADLRSSERKRKDLDGKIQVWKDEYDGKPYGNEQKGKSQIVSRDIKKQSEWQHASIIDPFVSTADIIKATPITFDDKDAAIQNEIVLNAQFCRQFNRFNFMTKAVKVLDKEGTVVVKTGWESEEDTVTNQYPDIQINPFTRRPEQVGWLSIDEIIMIKNQPTAAVCRNEDVFIDPTCMDNMEDCQFVIHRYETDYSTLKSDGRYKNLKKVMKNGATSQADVDDFDDEDDTAFEFTDEARKKLVVYEYWGNLAVDESNVTKPVVCAWIGDTVIRLEDNPFPDKKPPFIIVPFNSVPFQMHGEANAEFIGSNQKIKTALIRGMIDNFAQSNNAQKGIKKGALDGLNRKRFMGGQNFEFNGTKGDFFDGSYNQIPNSAFDMLGMQNNEIESITGQKSFSGGINGNSLGTTATGARGVMDATSTRRLNTVRNIAENLVKPLMRKWMSYNSEFLSEEEVVRMTSDEFVTVKRDDLEGRIDLAISVSTAEDNAAKAQELAFMLQTGQQTMDAEEVRMIRAEIARLQKMPDLAKKIEEYQPQPDPLAIKKAQLEIALLEAQVFNERAKGQENAVDVELKKAKTVVEQSKARLGNSTADQKDLDFLKDEGGTLRQREIEDKQLDNNAKLQQEGMKLAGRNQPSR